MTITYSWKITGIQKMNDPILELNDVVIQTYWTCTGIDEEGIEGTFIGATPFKPESVDPNTFTAYEDLTEELVLNWIKEEVKDSSRNYWDHISDQITKQIRQKKIQIKDLREDNLPWANKENEL